MSYEITLSLISSLTLYMALFVLKLKDTINVKVFPPAINQQEPL